jgi:hypothetical protein
MTRKIRLIIFTVLLLALLGVSVLAYHFYQESSSMSLNDKKSEEFPKPTLPTATTSIIDLIGKLIILPTGEEPTIATVSDPSKLKDQPFFVNAKTGDKVLIYQNAKKAYLYSVTENKLIEVAPINVGVSSTSTVKNTTVTNKSTPKK